MAKDVMKKAIVVSNGRKCGPTRGNLQVNSMNGGDDMECLICQNVTKGECLIFRGEAICGDCEARLMELAVDDLGYDIQVRAFRLLWQRQFLATRDRHHMEGDPV